MKNGDQMGRKMRVQASRKAVRAQVLNGNAKTTATTTGDDYWLGTWDDTDVGYEVTGRQLGLDWHRWVYGAGPAANQPQTSWGKDADRLYLDKSQDPLVIFYHAGCPDGATAAWVLRMRYWPERRISTFGIKPNMRFCPEWLDMVEGLDVWMVDVAQNDSQTVRKLAQVCRSFRYLDHHITSACCDGCPGCKVDTSEHRSAAQMVWDELHPGIGAPRLVRYAQDLDLWLETQPHTRDIWPLLRSVRTPDQAAQMATLLDNGFNEALARGGPLRAADLAMVESARLMARQARIGTTRVVAVQGSSGASEVGMGLAEQTGQIVVVWSHEGDGYRYSLRSTRQSGLDCAELATRHGGGGHRNAAAFRSKTQVLDFKEVG